MAFSVKNWTDGPGATPLDAAALEDLETRLSDHVLGHVNAGTLGSTYTLDLSLVSAATTIFVATLSTDCAITITNQPELGILKLIVFQDSSGGHSLTLTIDGDTNDLGVSVVPLAQTVAETYFYPTASTGSEYADLVLSHTPVAYWRLGESSGTTAVDEVDVNPGTYVGSITKGQTGALAGDADTGVLFNPADSVITVVDHASLDVGDVFTLECWVNRNGVTGQSGGFFSKQFNSFELEDVGDGTWRFGHSGVEVVANATTAIPTTGWHHIVATKDGATRKLYLDGTDVTGSGTNSTIQNNSSALWIGRSGNGRWYGKLDEVAIYATALTAGQVAAHYAAGT